MKHGWPVTLLGDVCRIIGGGTPPKANTAYYSGDILWATVRDMHSDLIVDTECKITKAAVANSSTNVIPGGNVVIATRVGLGKVCLLKQDTAINQDLRGIVPLDPKRLSVRFLFWWLRSTSDLIVAEGKGATVQGVTLPFIQALQLPLPPFPEQQRIVGVLEKAFEGTATAKANAETNLQNTRALFESHLQSVFAQRDKGWAQRQLGDLATFRNGINFTKSSRGESVKIVGVKDFQQHFWAQLDDLDSVTAEGTLPDSDMLRKNDLLFVRSNGNVELIGRCVLVGEVTGRITHSGFTIRARLNDGAVVPQYLCQFLKSGATRRRMIDGGTGTNIKSLNQTTLSALLVPLPPLAEQASIVAQLEAIDDRTRRLASLYDRKLSALDELKKSLLHQAFSGQL